MKRGYRRRASRRHRSRPTPKWLLRAEDIDQVARQRCLMVLSVLSGETPVTDAIKTAGISRGTYYQLETRALWAMLRSLGPTPSMEAVETSPIRQIAALEAKIKDLERAGRRSQRLLLMTRRVMVSREKRTGSTRAGRGHLPGSKGKQRPRAASSLTPAGATGG